MNHKHDLHIPLLLYRQQIIGLFIGLSVKLSKKDSIAIIMQLLRQRQLVRVP